MARVLVTGAAGFIGSAVIEPLLSAGFEVSATTRSQSDNLPDGVSQYVINNVSALTDWSAALHDVNVVIHTVAVTHFKNAALNSSLPKFREVNIEGTQALAVQAARAGVKRFIFLSSIKANGEATQCGQPFKPDSECQPIDQYGLSKYEAERALLNFAKDTSMEIVIIRPPLVYGLGVKANFAKMIKWVSWGIPLPFGALNNKRSFIALDNLVYFIILCISHPKAANEVFLISDGEDVSMTCLLKKISKVFKKKRRLIYVPVNWMMFVAKIIGREDLANRLFGTLQVDCSKAYDLLEWEPVITMDKQLEKIADMYLIEKTI